MDTEGTPASGARADQEISRYGVLGEPAGRDLQALVELAAQICEVPSAAINLITSTQQHQVATAGIDPGVCAREDSMCAAVVSDASAVVVTDASSDPRFAANPFVTGDLGEVRFYASAPLSTPSGVPLGRLCVFHDEPRRLTAAQSEALVVLAERVMDVLELRVRSRQLEESLEQLTAARDELHRSNQQLMLFAGQVSHDLRSPLMAVQANAELLASEPPVAADRALASMVEAIVESAQRMNTMIGEILAHASQGGRVRATRVDLGTVVATVLKDLAPMVEQTSATVDVGPLPEVGGDPGLLYSVVLNLLTNALKFAEPGSVPQVQVGAERRDGYWRVEVTDHGIGVPEEMREQMFSLFARGGLEVEGSGIGLATVKRAVEAHGGRVGMRTPPHRGTCVWFDLPAAPEG